MAKNNKTRFFYVLYSDKTRFFDQSERLLYRIYIIMHNIKTFILKGIKITREYEQNLNWLHKKILIDDI